MKIIPTKRGLPILVDDADYEWLTQWKWHAKAPGGAWYAFRCIQISRINGRQKQKRVRMHVQIMNPPAGFVVDHIDGNGLNNQRSNLRICTQAENSRNMRIHRTPGKISRFKGVSVDKRRGKFRAYIRSMDKKYMHLGYFDTEDGAARAYDDAAKQIFGEFANPNFKEVA